MYWKRGDVIDFWLKYLMRNTLSPKYGLNPNVTFSANMCRMTVRFSWFFSAYKEPSHEYVILHVSWNPLETTRLCGFTRTAIWVPDAWIEPHNILSRCNWVLLSGAVRYAVGWVYAWWSCLHEWSGVIRCHALSSIWVDRLPWPWAGLWAGLWARPYAGSSREPVRPSIQSIEASM